jgi:hypothetical protein
MWNLRFKLLQLNHPLSPSPWPLEEPLRHTSWGTFYEKCLGFIERRPRDGRELTGFSGTQHFFIQRRGLLLLLHQKVRNYVGMPNAMVTNIGIVSHSNVLGRSKNGSMKQMTITPHTPYLQRHLILTESCRQRSSPNSIRSTSLSC